MRRNEGNGRLGLRGDARAPGDDADRTLAAALARSLRRQRRRPSQAPPRTTPRSGAWGLGPTIETAASEEPASARRSVRQLAQAFFDHEALRELAAVSTATRAAAVQLGLRQHLYVLEHRGFLSRRTAEQTAEQHDA